MLSAAALADPLPRPAPPKPHPLAPSGYARQVRAWHESVDGPLPVDDEGRPLLVLSALNTRERAVFRAASDHGGFSATDLDQAALLLREPASGNAYPVEPRLMDLVYDLETHFQSREVRVISGYRTPRGRAASNHGRGRAIDLVVSGTADTDVAAYARTLGFVGVGIYPTSGFVHIDVRDRSYFWSDSSAPGRRNRERGILGDLAASSDRSALARGALPPFPGAMLLDVDAALRAGGSVSTPFESEEEDANAEENP
jgi:uncharacterized protein YcbK (DUF882 family)